MALLSFIPLSTLLMRGLGVRNGMPAWTSASCASLKICSLMLGDGIAQFHVSMVSERLPYSFQQAKKAYDTAYSQAVTHPSTNAAQSCLTSVIGRAEK